MVPYVERGEGGCHRRSRSRTAKRQHLRGVDARVGREAAGAGDGCHRLADAQVLDAGTDRIDGAGELGARNERQRRLELVLALDDQQIRESSRSSPRGWRSAAPSPGFGSEAQQQVVHSSRTWRQLPCESHAFTEPGRPPSWLCLARTINSVTAAEVSRR